MAARATAAPQGTPRDGRSQIADFADLAALANVRKAEVASSCSSERSWLARLIPKSRRSSHSRRDPELRKVLCRYASSLNDVERQSALHTSLDRACAMRLHHVLEQPVSDLDLDSAVEVVDALDQLLIEIADEDFLVSWYMIELYREQRRDEMESPFVTWSELFSRDLGNGPPHEAAATDDGTDRGGRSAVDELRFRLSALRRARSLEYRLHRSRLAMRSRTLLLFAPLLAVLVVALALAIGLVDAQGVSWQEVALAAVAGALGGTLSGMYKLRDHVERIADVRALKPALLVQPLIGGAAGLVILLVAVSGFLPPQGPGSAAMSAKYAVLAFVGGFSEPFFLGVVGRIANTGKGAAPTASASAGE